MPLVSHTPRWAPAKLTVDEDSGETAPGFRCVYPLENDNGLCGASTFDADADDDILGDDHNCVVE
jgi:hypothetical protein